MRTFTLSSQPEGMVASDKNATLYFGIEEEGIFKIPADPDKETVFYKLAESDSTNSNIVYDIEGLSLFNYNNSEYLIASSQGNYSYALFKIGKSESYITSFIIGNSDVDGVEETDGLDITTMPLNSQFPEGILVVQDGFNYRNDTLLTQNFKYMSVRKIKELLDK
jgi:3-phytase